MKVNEGVCSSSECITADHFAKQMLLHIKGHIHQSRFVFFIYVKVRHTEMTQTEFGIGQTNSFCSIL